MEVIMRAREQWSRRKEESGALFGKDRLLSARRGSAIKQCLLLRISEDGVYRTAGTKSILLMINLVAVTES